jgi:hypothetical protein
MASRRGPDNSVRIAITGTMTGRTWANVFFSQLATSSTITQADLDTYVTAFQAAYKARFAAVQSGSVAYSNAKGTLFAPGGGVLHSLIAMTGTGSEAGTDPESTAMAKVVSWLSTVYWRGGKPRTYLIGPRIADIDATTESTFTGAARTAVVTAANNFRTDVNALTAGTINGSVLGFVSFRSGNVERVTPLFFPVSGSLCHPRIGTQRRRYGKWAA